MGNVYCIALNFRRPLILRISQIFNHLQNYFNKNFYTLTTVFTTLIPRPHRKARMGGAHTRVSMDKMLPNPQGTLSNEIHVTFEVGFADSCKLECGQRCDSAY